MILILRSLKITLLAFTVLTLSTHGWADENRAEKTENHSKTEKSNPSFDLDGRFNTIVQDLQVFRKSNPPELRLLVRENVADFRSISLEYVATDAQGFTLKDSTIQSAKKTFDSRGSYRFVLSGISSSQSFSYRLYILSAAGSKQISDWRQVLTTPENTSLSLDKEIQKKMQEVTKTIGVSHQNTAASIQNEGFRSIPPGWIGLGYALGGVIALSSAMPYSSAYIGSQELKKDLSMENRALLEEAYDKDILVGSILVGTGVVVILGATGILIYNQLIE